MVLFSETKVVKIGEVERIRDIGGGLCLSEEAFDWAIMGPEHGFAHTQCCNFSWVLAIVG